MGALFAHELDAMTHHEWRLLPLLNLLPDDPGMEAFVVLHVPLFAALIALVASRRWRVRMLSRMVISAFMIVHAVLHTVLSGHPDYSFAGWLSNGLIYSSALFGLVALRLDFRVWRDEGDAHGSAL